ncbi:putative methylase [Atractiella rhizophila]|nr:putative methylase [Atractiella rhizophila]
MSFTLPTPDLSHLPSSTYDHVYEPAEDSFLLLDALEQDADELKAYKNAVCLEMGSGTGIASAALGSILGKETREYIYVATDINPHACIATRSTFDQSNVHSLVLRTSFASGLLPRLEQKVDIQLFNFPYVPSSPLPSPSSSPNVTSGQHIAASWKGGERGREVIDAWMEGKWMEKLASYRGRCYVVCLEVNHVEEIVAWANAMEEWTAEVMMRRRAGREKLCVIRFKRCHVR